MKLPSLVVSATQGHSGKTIVTIGICAALSQRGMVIQPFKKGPDYIDPSWIAAACGRDCRAIDPFLMSQEIWLDSFHRSCGGVDLALIEGVRGLYDSISTDGEDSTASIARLLGAPVVLIVNGSRMTRSVAAVVSGFQGFEPGTKIAGVILNHVSLNSHKKKLVAAIEQYCKIPVVGCIPEDSSLFIQEQHLGLRPFRATENGSEMIERVRDCLKNHIDMDAILNIAKTSRTWFKPAAGDVEGKVPTSKIGVMLDKVFNFYYPENLEALERAGAKLIYIDSLQDRKLPKVDGLYIGGGFPEFFPGELEANKGLRTDIAVAIEGGLPVYAECAGLMYLCQGLDWQGKRYEMVGVIPGDVELCLKNQGHGYIEAEVSKENPWLPVGLTVRGHQFHHSRLTAAENLWYAYKIKRRREQDSGADGIVYKNVFASYTHIHALGVPQWAQAFVRLSSNKQRHGITPTAA
ncbi:cobyrinate a,c-diamide synthase [Chloroflexota bacterium]